MCSSRTKVGKRASEDDILIKLRDVFRLEYISFMFMLYFLIFLGFNIYYTAFSSLIAAIIIFTAAFLPFRLIRLEKQKE